MEFANLKSINQGNLEQANEQVEKTSQELATLRTQEVFVKSIQALANIIQNHTTQTVVLNQLRDYATSKDITGVEQGVKDLLEQLKTHKNTDVTPIVNVLKEAVAELKAVPKDKLEFPEQTDYTQQFKDLVEETHKVLKAVQEQETTVEAPVVNVEAPNVTVEAPDLKPLTKEINQEFAKAIKSIVFPEYKVNLTKVEEKLDLSNKLLKDIRDTPSGGSSGSGGSIAPFLVDGALPITGTITAEASTLAEFQFNDSDATTTASTEYFGYTKPDGTWLVKKLTDTTLRYATVTNNGAVTTYGDAWAAIASLTYGRMDQAF